jgi:hypothetical protein
MFNRGTDTSTVLTGIDAKVKDQRKLQAPGRLAAREWLSVRAARQWRRHRELILTVLAFHVPR